MPVKVSTAVESCECAFYRMGLDHVTHSLMNADETNSISSLIHDVTYSVTPYVMTRLTMGTRLSKSPPLRSDWPHEDYFVCGPLERLPGRTYLLDYYYLLPYR
jgi:hypothetical protein